MATSFAELDDAEFSQMVRLLRSYRREANKCETSKAYLAGCVMLGAALEASLILMVHCFAAEVSECSAAPKKGGHIKRLLQWRLVELLRVAKALGWFPARLQVHEAWDQRRAQLGDYAEALRQLRNVVHPGGYLAELAGRRVTAKYLAGAFRILDGAQDYLLVRLNTALRNRVKIS